jgi:hypothetical protein
MKICAIKLGINAEGIDKYLVETQCIASLRPIVLYMLLIGFLHPFIYYILDISFIYLHLVVSLVHNHYKPVFLLVD